LADIFSLIPDVADLLPNAPEQAARMALWALTVCSTLSPHAIMSRALQKNGNLGVWPGINILCTIILLVKYLTFMNQKYQNMQKKMASVLLSSCSCARIAHVRESLTCENRSRARIAHM
jgi:hypothetical protein